VLAQANMLGASQRVMGSRSTVSTLVCFAWRVKSIQRGVSFKQTRATSRSKIVTTISCAYSAPRCAVPARDSQNGADLLGFQKRFSELRRVHYPPWACEPDRIKHFYHLGINTRVRPSEHGKLLRVGDVVHHTVAVY
jgi:hypothetical protein